MEYSEILKSLIGIPTLNSVIDNPFPIIGDSVTITSNSKWAKNTTILQITVQKNRILQKIVYQGNLNRLQFLRNRGNLSRI